MEANGQGLVGNLNGTVAITTNPIVIIGAGPVGLAAAAHLVKRGESPLVIEAGAQVGATVAEWDHVRLFSPWSYVVDEAARRLLSDTDWVEPDPKRYPTGRDLRERYLLPLASHPRIAPLIRLSTRVTAISRQAKDKLKTDGREDAPFVLRLAHPDGRESVLKARAVIDASGTWRAPNPLGADGLPAINERVVADRVWYGIPDVLGKDRERFAGRRVLVVGAGHSAFNALQDLAALAREAPGTEITWAVRRARRGQLFGGGASDGLRERGALGQRVRRLLERDDVRLVMDYRIERLDPAPDGTMIVSADDGRELLTDEIIAATGFRPDLDLTRELRLDLDETVEAPRALAPLIDPNVHSCGSVPPHGVDELSHPESGFYVVGMKSYGRAPTFLLLTGYEQVRSVTAAIVGDWDAARRVNLILPETGVCSIQRDDAQRDNAEVVESGHERELVGVASGASLAVGAGTD